MISKIQHLLEKIHLMGWLFGLLPVTSIFLGWLGLPELDSHISSYLIAAAIIFCLWLVWLLKMIIFNFSLSNKLYKNTKKEILLVHSAGDNNAIQKLKSVVEKVKKDSVFKNFSSPEASGDIDESKDYGAIVFAQGTKNTPDCFSDVFALAKRQHIPFVVYAYGEFLEKEQLNSINE